MKFTRELIQQINKALPSIPSSASSHLSNGQKEIIKRFSHKNKIKIISEKELVDIYIKQRGDYFNPQIIDVDKRRETKHYNTVSYHFKYNTSEYNLVLKPKIQAYFAGAAGRLLLKGALIGISAVELKD